MPEDPKTSPVPRSARRNAADSADASGPADPAGQSAGTDRHAADGRVEDTAAGIGGSGVAPHGLDPFGAVASAGLPGASGSPSVAAEDEGLAADEAAPASRRADPATATGPAGHVAASRPDRPTGPAVAGFAPPPAPGPLRIEGRHVRLERLDPDRHAEDLFAANRGQDWVWDYLGYGPFADLPAYRAWQAEMAARTDPYFYALRDGATGRIGGLASFMRIDPANGVIEIGHIEIAPAMQRSPAATEAISLMIGWAFGAGYRRVEWKCDALNAASRRAALRYGFTFEGVFRQHMIYKGRNRDTAWYAIIDRDWPRLARAHRAWLAPANFDARGRQRQSLSALTGA